MKMLKETVVTLLVAARYSFSFCWRNSRTETIAKIVIAVAMTSMIYIGLQSTGLIINGLQEIMTDSNKTPPLFSEVVFGDLLGPILLLLSVPVVGVIIGRFNWFYHHKWHQTLRFANQREINDHRATLDIARFRSKGYDDLQRQIQELPAGWQTRMWFSEEMFKLFTSVVSFALFGAALLWYKPVYALVLVVTAFPMMIMEFKTVAMWWNLYQALVPHHKKRNVLEKPYHSNYAFVQAQMFNQMSPLRREINANVDSVLESHHNRRKISLRREFFTHILAVAGLCGVIVHAIWSTVAFSGEIGTLMIIIGAAKTFQGNLEAIVSLMAEQWNSAKGVILIEKDFLGMKPVIQTPNPIVPNFRSTPVIRFEGVSFSYPDAKTEALNNVSFTIKPGTKVAIVGKSGNGKSTIQALLMRQYDPTSGSVFADDINLRNIEPRVWNQTVSALMQEYTVLERLLGEEIASSRLGDPKDLDAVNEACEFANFDEVVTSDPKGLQSQIGVEFGGRDFSGGEKQRLALARVRYRNTPIFIFDEPDARLDPESAQKVMDRIFALEGVTVVIITHHISCAERCDNVIVMGKGEVVEQGTHEELIALDGTYANMYDKDKKRLGQVEDRNEEVHGVTVGS